MAGIIYAGANTSESHGIFISWLNSLMNNYVVGFYDSAVSNLIRLSFIRQHNLYLQEMYPPDGKGFVTNFITVLPTDTTQNILMVHGLDGVPFLYNKTDIPNILEFTPNGTLKTFHQNVVIPLYDKNGVETHELFISFQKIFGIQSPMLIIKSKSNSLEILSQGILDCLFDGRFSGSYNVVTTPLEEVSYYAVTNISKMVIKADVPILKNLVIPYVINSGMTVKIPQTEFSDFYIRTGMDMDSIKYKLNKM